MTVKELIEELKKLKQDLPIRIEYETNTQSGQYKDPDIIRFGDTYEIF